MKERKLKVTYAPGTEYKDKIPRILLQGKWLKEFGVEVGDHIVIKFNSFEKHIIIYLDNNE